MIDLHTHTTCSDGDYSPRELINLASSQSLTALSITDHDTINAYSSDIIDFAENLGILLVPGIEFSTVDESSGETIHVIGLDVNINDNNLKCICDKIYESRRDSALLTADKLQLSTIVLNSHELLDTGAVITKTHIARSVINNPINQKTFLEIYGKTPTYSVFIEDFLTKGKPAFVEHKHKLSTGRAIEIIHQANGKAFCAHPSFNIMHGVDLDVMKQLIIRNKFDGVETINIQYDKRNNDVKFDMVKEFTDFAIQSNLLTSGGSDFHSDNHLTRGNHSKLGLANENYQITKRQLAEIIAV